MFPILEVSYVTRSTAVLLRMGLFDSPLPEKDSKRLEMDVPAVVNDEFMEFPVILGERLFSIQKDGKESRELLPPLRQRLDSGVECYFESNDKLVQNLIGKTSCNPDDACWALEACNGDITEAWTRISFAQTMILNELRDKQLLQEDPDYKADDYAKQVLDTYEMQKSKVKDQINRRKSGDYIASVKQGVQWTPIKNPNPVADEPWFTG